MSGHATAHHPVSQDALRSSSLRSIASGSQATAAAAHDSKSISFSSQPAEPTSVLQDAPATLHSSGSRDARVRAVSIRGAPFRMPRTTAAQMRNRNLPHACWLHRRKEGVTHPSGRAEPRQWHIPRPSPGTRGLPTAKACRTKASLAAPGTSGGRLGSFQNMNASLERRRKFTISVSSAPDPPRKWARWDIGFSCRVLPGASSVIQPVCVRLKCGSRRTQIARSQSLSCEP